MITLYGRRLVRRKEVVGMAFASDDLDSGVDGACQTVSWAGETSGS